MNAFRLALSCFVIMPGLVWTVFDARAQTCAQAPSCSQLGYTKAVADCTGKTTLLCPFDSSKAFCADDTTCAALGFTDTISECPGEYTLCPSDATKGKCIFEASPGDLKYSLRTAAHNGWLPCDGSTYSSTQFPELYAAISSSFGTKLPYYYNHFLKARTGYSGSSLATMEEAGLPDIYGYLGGNPSVPNDGFLADKLSSVSGAFQVSGEGDKNGMSQGSGGWGYTSLTFRASYSNSIYGNSTTVTPQNYSANVFIYAGRIKGRPSTESCAKGNYFYSDGTCSSTYTSSKTLLGMVTSVSSSNGKLVISYAYGGNKSVTSHDSVETACGCSTDSLCSDIADIYDARALVSMTIATNSVVTKPVSGRNYYGDFAFGPYTCSSSTCSQSSYSNASLTSGYYYCTKSMSLYTF